MRGKKIIAGDSLYCKNGEEVTVQKISENTITVLYAGKEYERSIDVLGIKLFAAEYVKFQWIKDSTERNGGGIRGIRGIIEGEITWEQLEEIASKENLFRNGVVLFHSNSHNGPMYSVVIHHSEDKWMVFQVHDDGPRGGYWATSEGNANLCALKFLREMNEERLLERTRNS